MSNLVIQVIYYNMQFIYKNNQHYFIYTINIPRRFDSPLVLLPNSMMSCDI